MPLNLSVEESESLNRNTKATGSTLEKLLMHYNKDLEGMKTHVEINSERALEYQLRRIGGEKSLLILNVNALDKNFTGETNHYVGLVIEPTIPASVQYIDPLGERISPVIKDFINDTIVGSADITEYTSGLQYAAGERNSRLMLVYLMTKAAHSQELPVLPDVEDKVKESKAIGRRLRRKYKSDNGKEIGASTDLVNLKLDDLASSRNDFAIASVAEKEFASVDTSSSAAVKGEWILRDDDDSQKVILRESYNPDMVSRRLDSIARLITGGDICAAVAFDGQNILYSNNSGEENAISKRVFRLLSDVAKGEMTIESIERNKELNRQMELIAETGAIQMAESKRSRKGGPSKDALISQYKPRLLRDLKIVIGSLTVDSSEKFPEELVQAFRNPKRFEFVSGRSEANPGVVHAEMAILDRVVSKDGIEVYDRDVVAGRKPFYIGLTMLCCKDCRNAVVAYNEVSAEESKISIADDSLFQAVGVRGQHLQQYNNWTPPDFFERRPAVAGKYQEIKKRGQKYNPGGGKVLADDSNSEPEIDDVKSRKLAKTSAIATSPVLKASSASRLPTAFHAVNSERFSVDAGSYVDPRDIGRFSPTTSADVGQQGKKRKIEKI